MRSDEVRTGLPVAGRSRPIRSGFSLIEVMIAMVLLTIVVTTLAGLTFALSRRSITVAGRAFETGLLTQEIDRAVAVPVESLALSLGSTRVDTPSLQPWPFERRVAITGRADSLTVRVAIKPLNVYQRRDSVVQSVLRTR